VSIMHAQNEVGTLQPIAAIATVAHRAGALLHTDAAQSLGKVPVRAEDLGVDLLSVAGHKFYGPKGVGALWLREGVTVEKQIHGAGQERGLRAGTENVLLIAGLGAAAELAAARLDDEAPRLARLRDALEDRLLAEAAPAVAHGRTAPRLPNTCSIGFPGLIAADLMGAMPEVECSAGSACNADGIHVSPVLQAMGVGPETAAGTLRLSLGRFTTEAEVDRAGAALVAAVGKLRG